MTLHLKTALILVSLSLFGYNNPLIQIFARIIILPASILFIYFLPGHLYVNAKSNSLDISDVFFILYPLASFFNSFSLPSSQVPLVVWKSIEILLLWVLVRLIVAKYSSSLNDILSFTSKTFLIILILAFALPYAFPSLDFFAINANMTASFSMLLLPLFVFTSNPLWAVAASVTACFGISKTSLIAFIIAFALGALIITYKSILTRFISKSFLWLFCFGLAGVIISSLLLQSSFNNYDSISTLSGRSLIWESYLSITPNLYEASTFVNPSALFSGIGIGGSRFLFESFDLEGVNRAISAHNSFIEVFISTGLVPFLLFVSFCFSFLLRLFKLFFNLRPGLSWLFFASGLTIIFRCMTSSSLAFLTPELFVFLLMYNYAGLLLRDSITQPYKSLGRL